MKNVFVTGSTAGIGLATAEQLKAGGHRVVLHARNDERAAVALAAVTDAVVIVGELGSLDQTKALSAAAAEHAPFDAIVHNAGIYESGAGRTITADGLERTFQVNVLAPYVLTCLIPLPARLIYLSSGMATGGHIVVDDLHRRRRPWSAVGAYSDSKLCDIALALAMARRHPEIAVTAVDPGWVRTRMGGAGAPTSLQTGAATQVWLASSDDPDALRSGRFMRHMSERPIPDAAADVEVQEALLAACDDLSGVKLPA